MSIAEIQRQEKSKTIGISIRVTPEQSQWMSKHKVSPTKLFNRALKEAMEQTNGTTHNIRTKKRS